MKGWEGDRRPEAMAHAFLPPRPRDFTVDFKLTALPRTVISAMLLKKLEKRL